MVLVAVARRVGRQCHAADAGGQGRPIAPMLGWAMLYGASSTDCSLDLRRSAGRGSAAGYWIGSPISACRLGARLGSIRDQPQDRPARAAYSSVLIPIIAC